MDTTQFWPIGLTVLLAIGAYTDVTARRLPNWLALVLLVFGLVAATVLGGWAALGWHTAHAVIALVVGMVLFAIGAFGGGDAKFYAGMAAFFPLSQALNLFVFVAISGLVLIIAWLVLKRTVFAKRTAKEGDFAKFPYGIAIAVGGLIAAWLPLTGVAPRAL